MTSNIYEINLVFAWFWILLTFISGGLTGMTFRFFKTEWMGGYSGLRRRLYRLGHVSFFALGIVNLLFYFTVQEINNPSGLLDFASSGFIIGAVTMPFCCYIMSHYHKLKYLFYIPVISLIMASIITIGEILRS